MRLKTGRRKQNPTTNTRPKFLSPAPTMPSRRNGGAASDLGAPLLPGDGGDATTAAPPAEPDRGRRGSTLLSVCPFILGNEFCERLAFYG